MPRVFLFLSMCPALLWVTFPKEPRVLTTVYGHRQGGPAGGQAGPLLCQP